MFSELVDNVVQITGRRDKLDSIAGWVRATIRDAQMSGLYSGDFVEYEVVADSGPAFVWNPPRPLRRVSVVWYNRLAYVENLRPGSRSLRTDEHYYQSGSGFVFVGVYAGLPIQIGAFIYSLPLQYQLPEARLVRFDTSEMVWKYAWEGAWVDAIPLGDAAAARELEERRRNGATHWLLEEWSELILQGTLNKLYMATDDKQRMSSSYSLYQSQLNQLKTTFFEGDSLP